MNPAFLFSYSVIQAGVLLIAIRFLDVYGRQPFGIVGLVAAWGATGAAAVSIAGDKFVSGMLNGNVRIVFGDAISAPLVEEAAKGLALIVAIGPLRMLLRKAGVNLFDGPGAGMVYGAAVGLGFGFTEDMVYLVNQAKSSGISAGFHTYFYRRDFFGPAILHHAVFTAAFGAGLGLATWTTSRVRKVLYPLAGFALAVLMHAVNDGVVQVVAVWKHGLAQTAVWTESPAAAPGVAGTANSVERLMRVVDYYYLAMFVGVILYWTSRQRRVIREQLAEEVELGLITSDDYALMFDTSQRLASEWRLVRSGQLEQLRHSQRVRRELAQLGLTKWRIQRVGGDQSRVNRARREIATLSTYQIAPLKLPVTPTPLIGRDRELTEIGTLLLGHGVRVVTLLGPGGTGKTRLSIEVASVQRERFPGGVYFVELAALSDPDLVPTAIADVVEVRAAPGQTVVAALQDHLRDKQLLLVLDNFEQVTPAATAIAEILTAAQRVTVLVSSREPLRIKGEKEFPVPPLALPDPAHVNEIAANPSVCLFVDRASAIDPAFRLTPVNGATIARICISVDGLPLAIELAAARINVLTPEAILERLGEHLQLLTGGTRDLPARHQALRSTIDWSYDMLPPAEQTLFRRLGVFVGGATLPAIEAVCLDTGQNANDVLDAIGSLRDKSLLRRAPEGLGEPRFAMLATIREYAVDRLSTSDDLVQLRERHARYFVGLAQEAEAHLSGADQAIWYDQLDHEVDNFRAVLQWSSQTGDVEVGVGLVSALTRFWSMRGIGDPSRWLETALATGDLSPATRAKGLYAEGYAALDHGDFLHAERCFESSVAAYQGMDDARGAAAALAQLAFLLLSRGESVQAVSLAEESADVARRYGDANVESVALSTLAEAAARAGELPRATELYERSLALRRRLGDRRNIANGLLNLGRVALAGGEYERAHALLDQGLSLGREVADTWSISVALASLGRLALGQGRAVEGRELLVEALGLAADRGGKRLAAECLTALAMAASDADPKRAAQLFGAAETLRATIGVTLSPIEAPDANDTIQRIRATLGEYDFTMAWQTGLALNLDEAVALARGVMTSSVS